VSDRDDVRVGLFVLVAGALLVAMTLWILGRGVMAAGGSRVEVRLLHSGGVRAGDRVRVAGVETGRIQSIALAPGEELPVRVEVKLSGGVVIHEGARAKLMADSLLGGTYLEIEPGAPSAPALGDGDFVAGEPRASLDTVFVQLGELSVTADQTLLQLQEVVANLSAALEPTIERLALLLSDRNLESIESLLAGADRTLEDLGGDLSATLERVDGLIEQVGSATAEVPELVRSLDRLTGSLQAAIGEDGGRIAELLETAESSLGGLDTEQGELTDLLRDLRIAAANLRSLSDGLRERPSSLLGLGAPRDRKPGDPAPKRKDGSR
jgi:phospholipid/cholesterol/gamma-HCH transport system substrate-binding protein